MANTELKVRIVLCSKTSSEWESDTTVLLNGEFGLESDTRKLKVGNGIDTFDALPYINMTPEEIQVLINAASHTHSNLAILNATTASFTTALLEKLNGIAVGANKTIVDSTLLDNSINPVQNKIIKNALDNKVSVSRKVNGKPLSADVTLNATDVGAISATQKGITGGVAELDSTGKVPTSQLPSYVDDVIEGYYSAGKFYKDSAHASEITGESGKIYTDLSSNKVYRWSGTTMIEISASLALGTTSSTAGRGDWTQSAYDHSQSAHAPSNAERNVIVGIQKNGIDLAINSTTRKVNIDVPTKVSQLTNDNGYITSEGTIVKAKQWETPRKVDGVNLDGTKDIIHYAECKTAATTTAKSVDIEGFSLVTGARISVKFTITNTASNPTLNVGGTGAKSIMYHGSAIPTDYLVADRVYEFIYNGTYWELVGDINTDTTYTAGTGLTLSGNQFKHTNSITAGTSKVEYSKALTYGGYFSIPYVNYDSQGHITGKGYNTMTMPAVPTTVDNANKLTTARNISISGEVTSTAVEFDGSKDITLNATKVHATALYLNSNETLILNGNFD